MKFFKSDRIWDMEIRGYRVEFVFTPETPQEIEMLQEIQKCSEKNRSKLTWNARTESGKQDFMHTLAVQYPV